MTLLKDKKFKKSTLFLLQVLLVGAIFFLFFQEQAVFFVKELVDKLNLHGEFELLLARAWASFKLIINSPSLFSLFLVIIHIMTFSIGLSYIKEFIVIPSEITQADVKEPEYVYATYTEPKNTSYLKNMRLLF